MFDIVFDYGSKERNNNRWVLHELVRQESNDCKGCSLYYTCHTYRFTYDKLCDINYAKGIIYKFINRGKVTDIKIDKEE